MATHRTNALLRNCVLVAGMLLLESVATMSPANAFVVNASDRASDDPLEAAPTGARWNSNVGSLVETGERGLGGGLEFSLDSAFCSSLQFADGTTCADIRALIVAVGEKWGEGRSDIFLTDVSDVITAAEPDDYATSAELGAEINFFAVTRAEMPSGFEDATAVTHTLVSYVKPQSTNGTTQWNAEGTITHATIRFPTDNCYYLVVPAEPERCVPFALTLLHELGHALGLGHPDELTKWNLDSDDDPATPVQIQCLNPLGGLHHSENYASDAIMISTLTSSHKWQPGLAVDDLAGRDFLYPSCNEDEIANGRIAGNAQTPVLSIPVNANFYPIDSLLLNEEGRVLLDLTVAPDQSIASAAVHTSSGYPRLDEAAVAIATNSRFAANQGEANGNITQVIPAEVVWELPLHPAFDIGLLSPSATILATPPYLTKLPDNPTLLRLPRSSASAGDQGVVRVRARISEAGEVLNSQVIETSGYDDFDAAALALTNASAYDPATRSGQNTESAIEMAFAYAVLPGRPSSRCYSYPIDANIPTIRISNYPYGDPGDNPRAERWVMVNQGGEIETMILDTERGWMHVDETLQRRWGPSATVPEDHPQQICWYYRPFIIPRR